MRNVFLKFSSEEEADQFLIHEGVEVYKDTDVIGVLYELPPEPLPEDYVPVPLDGWHVNLALDACPEELRIYEVVPRNPHRVYGGID